MITCPYCQSEKTRPLSIDPVRPEYDLFECKECAKTWSRYEFTKYANPWPKEPAESKPAGLKAVE